MIDDPHTNSVRLTKMIMDNFMDSNMNSQITTVAEEEEEYYKEDDNLEESKAERMPLESPRGKGGFNPMTASFKHQLNFASHEFHNKSQYHVRK